MTHPATHHDAGPRTTDVTLFEPPPALQRFTAADLIRLMVGLVVLLVAIAAAAFAKATIAGVETDLVDAVGRAPDGLEQVAIGAAQLIATFAPLVALVAMLWYRRWRTLLHVWIASVVAQLATTGLLIALGERGLIDEAIAERGDDGGLPLVAADFPTTGYLAAAMAALTVGAGHLPRRWRRAAWAWLVLLVFLRLLGPGQPPLDVWIALASGSVIGSALLLVLGSPNREPSPAEMLAGLRAAGSDPLAIERLTGPDGQLIYATRERDGTRTFVKLRTPDDRNWDLLSRLYRAIRLRSSETRRPYSTLKRRVEHEALAIHTARDAGVRSPSVRAIGVTSGDSVFLVEDLVDGTSFATIPDADLDDRLAHDAVAQVGRLHAARVAHRHLTPDNLIADRDGRVWLVDYDDAELAAGDRDFARDVAELLVALGTRIGADRAVAAGVAVLGTDAVARCLPLLQPLALSRTLGPAIRERRGLLDELRAAIHERTGAPDVELERLARIRPRTLVMILAGTLAFYSLLPQFGNLDDTVDALGTADWRWIPALLGVPVAIYLFATVVFLGSVAQPVALAAAVRCQVAASFAQLVGPAGTGRMALIGRFLQRNGLTASQSGASVALGTVVGLTTHMLLFAAFFAWAGGVEVGGLSLPGIGTILLVVAGAAVLIGIAAAIPALRRRAIVPVVDGLRHAAGYAGLVLRSPLRVAALVGGSACVTLCYLFGVVIAVQAFDGGVGVAEVGATYLGAVAIASIAPTPGGIGPLEAAMIAGLSGFGMPAGAAISAVLTFRLATFWLPIVPGWGTFIWMERRGEI